MQEGAMAIPSSIPSGIATSSYERQLVKDCKEGNRAQFQVLIEPYLRSIKLIAYSILKNTADMEEVAQEAILKAYMHIGQLREGESFKAWLLQIVGNEARMRLRKDRKHLYESVEQETNEKPFQPRQFVSWRDIPSDELERKEIRDALAAALECLEDGYREVFILRDIQHLSSAEVGKVLGLSEGAVNVRLHRARMQMREHLTPLFRKPGRGAGMISLKMMVLMGKTMMRKTVSCRHVTRQVSAYIDGQLDQQTRAKIEEHLKYCDRCSVVVDTTRKLLYVSGDEKVFDLPFQCRINWDQIVKSKDFEPPGPAG
jgi:RNA polymerase sigma-70 factor, ECF subfamily